MTKNLDTEPLRPLRVEGGFLGAMRAALEGWWREIFILTGLNLLWTVAFFSIVMMPPATAAMFYTARRVLQRDPFVGWGTFAQPIRRHWRAAWGWGLLFFLIAGVAGANLWLYRDALGTLWTLLRWLWATILVVWLTLNLFFWPLWFAEAAEYRTVRTTFRNSVAFLSANPFAALFATIAILLFATVSTLTGVLLGTLFMAWTALFATAILAAYLPRET
ncbi:MAG: DUF624 domain-containing protein [Chloroflexota bacterium]|nr:DUF624 domain-containing protein [Chloroflexota bacterium]